MLLLKDVFEGFDHRSLKLNHFKQNSQCLNLGFFLNNIYTNPSQIHCQAHSQVFVTNRHETIVS